MNQVFAFDVSVHGTDWSAVINARSAGKAKYQYWLSVRECWPDIPITAMRSRKLGKPQNVQGFEHTKRYRQFRFNCGDRVRVGISSGVIVGSNSSANFNVLFDDDDPRHPGLTLNVHPSEIESESETRRLAELAELPHVATNRN